MTSSCIGVVAPFSTEEAVVAAPMLAAVEEVVAAIDPSVRVLARDDARDPERAAAVVAELLATPGCLGLVGPKNSGSALVAAPLAAAAGLPLVLPCATADELTASGAPVFRLCAPDRATAAAAVALAAELGAARGSRCSPTTPPTGRASRPRWPTPPGRSAWRRTRRVDATAVAFLAMGEVEQAVLMRRLRDDGYGGAFISAEGGPDAPIAALAGDAAEGSWLLYPGTPVTARSVYAAEAADAARILLGAGAGGADAIRCRDVRRRDRTHLVHAGRRARRHRREPVPRRRRHRAPRQLMRTRGSRSA